MTVAASRLMVRWRSLPPVLIERVEPVPATAEPQLDAGIGLAGCCAGGGRGESWSDRLGLLILRTLLTL